MMNNAFQCVLDILEEEHPLRTTIMMCGFKAMHI